MSHYSHSIAHHHINSRGSQRHASGGDLEETEKNYRRSQSSNSSKHGTSHTSSQTKDQARPESKSSKEAVQRKTKRSSSRLTNTPPLLSRFARHGSSGDATEKIDNRNRTSRSVTRKDSTTSRNRKQSSRYRHSLRSAKEETGEAGRKHQDVATHEDFLEKRGLSDPNKPRTHSRRQRAHKHGKLSRRAADGEHRKRINSSEGIIPHDGDADDDDGSTLTASSCSTEATDSSTERSEDSSFADNHRKNEPLPHDDKTSNNATTATVSNPFLGVKLAQAGTLAAIRQETGSNPFLEDEHTQQFVVQLPASMDENQQSILRRASKIMSKVAAVEEGQPPLGIDQVLTLTIDLLHEQIEYMDEERNFLLQKVADLEHSLKRGNTKIEILLKRIKQECRQCKSQSPETNTADHRQVDLLFGLEQNVQDAERLLRQRRAIQFVTSRQTSFNSQSEQDVTLADGGPPPRLSELFATAEVKAQRARNQVHPDDDDDLLWDDCRY